MFTTSACVRAQVRPRPIPVSDFLLTIWLGWRKFEDSSSRAERKIAASPAVVSHRMAPFSGLRVDPAFSRAT